MNIKILQLGDLHLDAAYARLAPNRAGMRRQAARELLDEAVALAQSENAAMILCTGDLFDTPAPYRDTVEAAVAAFRRAGIPVFLTPGNHDPYTRTSPYFAADWSENVHIFTSETPETVSLPEIGCEVTGIAFRSDRPALRPLADIAANPDKFSVFIGHGEVAADSDYAAYPTADIGRAGFDLVALGHIHIPETKTVGKTLVVQNGSAEGHGYDEAGEHGYTLITITDMERSARLIPSSGMRAVRLEADESLTETDDILRFADAHCPHPERTMVRLVCSAADPEALEAELRSRFLDCKLVLRAATANGNEAFSSPLLKLFAQKADAARRAAKTPEEQALADLAVRFGEAAMLGREQPRGIPTETKEGSAHAL